jgi:site-specific DNA recombinase
VRLSLLPHLHAHDQQADLLLLLHRIGQLPPRRRARLPEPPDPRRRARRVVWAEVRRLLEDPALVRAEIDRRLQALRTEHPAARRRDALERDLTRADGAITRLIEAYQEQLISLDELRARMPALRKRQSTVRAQLDALDNELHDAETYLKLADTLEGFLGRLADGLDQLSLEDQQRILRLVVREVLIGGDDDKITIRHSIPTPTGGHDGTGCPLRGSSPLAVDG